MALTLPAVPPYFDSPKMDYEVAQNLQKALADELLWLERAYHIARTGIISEDKVGYPQIYSNNGSAEHFNIRPDLKVKAYSFFEIDSPYTIDYFKGDLNCFFSLVFWGQLNNINSLKQYDFTSELVQDVINVLKENGCDQFRVETRPEKIFDKYSGLLQETRQHLMRPFTAFKISFKTITNITNCP